MNVNTVGFRIQVAVLALCAMPALAADIIINWENKGDPLCPAQVNWSKKARIIVTNVNDLLYTYHIYTRIVPRVPNDFEALRGGAHEAATSNCAAAVLAAENAAAAFNKEFGASPALNPQPDSNGKYGSIPLSRTVAAWLALRSSAAGGALRDAEAQLKAAGCAPPRVFTEEWDRYQQWEKALTGDHRVDEPYTLQPDTDIEVTVSEFFRGVETARGAFMCRPASGVLSFSAGTMISSLPNRSYERRRVPSGADVRETLVVGGNSSVSPTGAAFLNYRVADLGFTGLSLTAGPVFRFTGEPGTSNFGMFGGVSFRIWDRLFLTPGAHVGEFADFPAGFNPGDAIPANFGQLDPVKRWTVRFGVGLTFRTADFGRAREAVSSSKVIIGNVEPPAPAPAEPATPPAPAPAKPATPTSPQPSPTNPAVNPTPGTPNPPSNE